MGFRSFFGWFGWDFKSFNGIYFMVRFGYYNRINSLDASKNGEFVAICSGSSLKVIGTTAQQDCV